VFWLLNTLYDLYRTNTPGMTHFKNLCGRIIKCLVVSTVLLFPIYLWKWSIHIKYAIFTFTWHKYCAINLHFNTFNSNLNLFAISKQRRNVKLEVAANAFLLPSADFNFNEKIKNAIYESVYFTLIICVYFDSGNRHEINIF
jgi:hypothetical protein